MADVDIEALGLLDGLEGDARAERAQLIAWLLERGFSIDHIRASVAAPLMLPAYRVLGDDGELVSAREVCESTGVELELLQRLQRAVGLPCIEDPDAVVLLRADGEAAARANVLIEMGIAAEDAVAVMRVVVESLGHAAAIMREAALKAILRPGATEIELAEGSEQLALQAAPNLGPMMDDLMRMVLRHSFEMEAVNAAERAAGTLPGSRPVTIAFADLAGFTRLGEALPAEELEHVASRLAELAHDVAFTPVRFVKSIGDAVMLVSVRLRAAVVGDARLGRCRRGKQLAAPADWPRLGVRGHPGRGLVRQSGQSRKPRDRRRASGNGARRGVHARFRRECRRLRMVAGRHATSQGRERRRETLPGHAGLTPKATE